MSHCKNSSATFLKMLLQTFTQSLNIKFPVLITLLISFSFNQAVHFFYKYSCTCFNKSVFIWTFCQLLYSQKNHTKNFRLVMSCLMKVFHHRYLKLQTSVVSHLKAHIHWQSLLAEPSAFSRRKITSLTCLGHPGQCKTHNRILSICVTWPRQARVVISLIFHVQTSPMCTSH